MTVEKLLEVLPLTIAGSHGPGVLRLTRLTINKWDCNYRLGWVDGTERIISGVDDDLAVALQKLIGTLRDLGLL